LSYPAHKGYGSQINYKKAHKGYGSQINYKKAVRLAVSIWSILTVKSVDTSCTRRSNLHVGVRCSINTNYNMLI